jgi:hypothetical protein
LIVCDTTLSSSAAGAVLDDATGAEAKVSAETVGDVVILPRRVSRALKIKRCSSATDDHESG